MFGFVTVVGTRAEALAAAKRFEVHPAVLQERTIAELGVPAVLLPAPFDEDTTLTLLRVQWEDRRELAAWYAATGATGSRDVGAALFFTWLPANNGERAAAEADGIALSADGAPVPSFAGFV